MKLEQCQLSQLTIHFSERFLRIKFRKKPPVSGYTEGFFSKF